MRNLAQLRRDRRATRQPPHSGRPVRSLLEKLDSLAPRWTHAMHGGSIEDAHVPPYGRALREQDFAYNGSLFDRRLQSQ
jgi:hypothetical protein